LANIFKKIESPAVFGATGSLGRCVCGVLALEGIRCAHLGGFCGHDRLADLIPAGMPLSVSFSGTPSRALAARMREYCVTRTQNDAEALGNARSAIVVSSGLDGCGTIREAISRKHPVATGNKETIVAWGRYLKGPVARAAGGCDLRPVDSEHAAAAVLLDELGNRDGVKRLVITGTGGAVRDVPAELRHNLPASRVLQHPVWKMGAKITVDSATLVNKALEIVEASILFDLPPERISVLFDPDARIHAALETGAGYLAFSAPATMTGPVRIALGLNHDGPSCIISGPAAALEVGRLATPDANARRAIDLGYAVLAAGGCSAMVLAVADDAAVTRFLAGNIAFGDIVPFIETALDAFRHAADMDPESWKDLSRLRADVERYAEQS